MPTYISQDEFNALISEAQTDLSPRPVFVQPKLTDRGYFTRREALTTYRAKQTDIIRQGQALERDRKKLAREGEKAQKVVDGLQAAKEEAEKDAEANGFPFDPKPFNEEIAKAQLAVDAFDDQIVDIAEKAKKAIEQGSEIMGAQIALISPYIRAIRYPQADGTNRFWPRPPKDALEHDEFETAVCTLLRDVSQSEFEEMIDAIVGSTSGTRAVPTNSGGK